MPHTCLTCRHPEREAINSALAAGEAVRRIAARTGTSASALQRHKMQHLPVTLTKAVQEAEVIHAHTLYELVRMLQAKALGILAKAEAAGDLRTALLALREARCIAELQARVQGARPGLPPAEVWGERPEVTKLEQRLRAIMDLAPHLDSRTLNGLYEDVVKEATEAEVLSSLGVALEMAKGAVHAALLRHATHDVLELVRRRAAEAGVREKDVRIECGGLAEAYERLRGEKEAGSSLGAAAGGNGGPPADAEPTL